MHPQWTRAWHRINTLDPAFRVEGVDGISTPQDVVAWTLQHVRYKRDVADFWMHPRETLERGEGDCEDQAIVAMWLARQTGVDPLPVLLIFETGRRSSHAVCYLSTHGIILDNHGVPFAPGPDWVERHPILAQAWLQGIITESQELGQP